mgnify:FL=1
MPWSGEKLRSAVFDADAVLHDQDFLRELADYAKIMGNQNQAGPEPFPDPMELCHNLPLVHGVQRRCGLIGNDDIGALKQRHRDHTPLQHASGKLVRIFLEHIRRIVDVHHLQSLNDASPALLFRKNRCRRPECFKKLRPHGVKRIERRHRLLDYHGDSLAADAAHGFPACLQEVDAAETDTSGNPQGRRRQSQQSHARQRFAAAAFPNDAKAGSRFKAKMHIPYDQRPGKGVSDSQTPHFK